MTTSFGRSSGDEWFPRHDISDHRDSAENADPRLAKEPELRIEPADPMLPIDNIENALPIDNIE
jgi:hypothetical protein